MTQPPLSFGRLMVANLVASPRSSLALIAGVSIATAVIVGALVVGDSMRSSLRALTVERLGRIETVIAPGQLFEIDGMAPEDASAVMLFPMATVEFTPDRVSSDRARVSQSSSGDSTARASGVTAMGIDQRFWDLDVGQGDRPPVPGDQEVILNQSLAHELGVEEGDEVTIRLPVEGAVPADSPLGRSELISEGLPRMKVIRVLPDRGLARFGLSANQAAPMNVFLNRETIASVLDRPGQANAWLIDRPVEVTTSPAGDEDADVIRVDLADLGLQLETQSIQGGPSSDDSQPKVVSRYQQLTSTQLLLPEPVVDAIATSTSEAMGTSGQPVMTYLANAIERWDESGQVVATVPYSIVTAMDDTESFRLNYERSGQTSRSGQMLGGDPQPSQSSDAIPLVINSWTAERLDASVGTPLRIAYYEPEVEDGNEIERYLEAVVTDIVPITAPSRPYRRRRAAVFDQPPTVYNDPHLTPLVPGVTDQDSISDWDLPFPLKREITRADDDYWNQYRLTPKAFLPLSDGQRWFGSRFGQVTSIRFPEGSIDESTLLAAMEPRLGEIGWAPVPIRARQLAASRGTTPFDGLFLALSSFVIFSAVLLVVMLLRLSLQTRLKQLGVMAATGWSVKRITRLLLGESLIGCGCGALLGGVLGMGYGKWILTGLTTRWVGAVTVPFLQYHASPMTLVLGMLIGFVISMITMAVVCRRLGRRSPQSLLSGREDELGSGTQGANRGRKQTGGERTWTRSRAATMVIAALAVGVMVVGGSQGGIQAAGGLVAGGMLLLVAALIEIHRRLSRPGVMGGESSVSSARSVTSLVRLARTNASRSPTRSTLAIGLMSVASFLIVAMTAFSLRPTEGGTGGYEWIATASAPLYKDISNAKVQRSFFGRDAERLLDVTIEPFRRRLGQDASCNNLYRADAPTVLGVRPRFGSTASGTGFDWASHVPIDREPLEDQAPLDDDAPSASKPSRSVWSALQPAATGTPDDPIPVVIDQNTAMWSLAMTGGIGEVKAFEYDERSLSFQVVGLLAGSTLQGRLLIGERNFNQAFPDISGYSFFLVDANEASDEAARQIPGILENRLSDHGLDVRRSEDVLAAMLAVQNTYLSTFQSLGALGLLLGTVGLAAAQWRSVLQRRGELAVMRAIGFTRRRLAMMVVGETTTLLLLGVGCGLVCALAGVVPIWIGGGVPPDGWSPIFSVLGILAFGISVAFLLAGGVLRMPLVDSLRSDD